MDGYSFIVKYENIVKPLKMTVRYVKQNIILSKMEHDHMIQSLKTWFSRNMHVFCSCCFSSGDVSGGNQRSQGQTQNQDGQTDKTTNIFTHNGHVFGTLF